MVGLAAAVAGLADAGPGMAAAVEGVAPAVEGCDDGVAGATEAVEGVADAVKRVADGTEGFAAAVVGVATAVRGVAPVAEEVAVGVAPAVEGLLPLPLLPLDPASPALLGEVVEGGEEVAVVAKPGVGGKLGEEAVREAAPGVGGVLAVTAAGFEVDGVVAETGDDAEVLAEAALVGVEPDAAGAAAGEVAAVVTEPEPGEGKEVAGVVADAGVVVVIGAVGVPDGVATAEAGVGEAVVGVAEGVTKEVTVPEEASGAGTGMLEGAGGGLGVEPVPEGVGDDDTELGTGTAGDPEEEENAVPGDEEEILGLVTEEALKGDGIPEDCPGDEMTPTSAADEAEDGPGDAVRTAGDVDAVPGDAKPGGVGDAWLAAKAAAMLASMACSEVLAGTAKNIKSMS